MTYRPRQNRDEIRGRAAFAVARAGGKSALDAMLAAMDAQFGAASTINSDKIRVERIIQKSFGHPEVRARYRGYVARIAEFGFNLDQACAYMRAECAERRPFERIRLPSMVRAELLLILRWMRRKRMHVSFAETVDAMRVPVSQLEAAE